MTYSHFLTATAIYSLSAISTPKADLLWAVYQNAIANEHSVEEIKKTLNELCLYVGELDYFLGFPEEFQEAYEAAIATATEPMPEFTTVYDVVKAYVEPFAADSLRLELPSLTDMSDYVPPRFAPIESQSPLEVIKALLPTQFPAVIVCRRTAAVIHNLTFCGFPLEFYVPEGTNIIGSSTIKPIVIPLAMMDTACATMIDGIMVTSEERTLAELIAMRFSVHTVYDAVERYLAKHEDASLLYDVAQRYGVPKSLMDRLVVDVEKRKDRLFIC